MCVCEKVFLCICVEVIGFIGIRLCKHSGVVVIAKVIGAYVYMCVLYLRNSSDDV